MKRRILFLSAVLAAVAACDLGGDGPMVPDETPFIVGVLEVSPDTAVHHPQVFVGHLSDPQDTRYSIFSDPEANMGRELFLPDLWAQVIKKAEFLSLRPMGVAGATVTVTGPLGATGERAVTFGHEGRGVYGDAAHALPLVPGSRYRLDVALADGRRYRAETHTPQPYRVTVPDTLRSPTRYIHHGPGNWSEVGEDVVVDCQPDPDPGSPVSVWSASHHRVLDAETFLVPSWQHLDFADRGDHQRGSLFQVATPTAYPGGMVCDDRWVTDVNTSRWDESPLYVRLTQLSDDLAAWYEVPLPIFSTLAHPDDGFFDDPWYTAVITRRARADGSRDRTYLPSITNLRAVAADGSDAASTDAVGVFGGLTARYFTRTIVPVRSFDPDTLDWDYHPDHP